MLSASSYGHSTATKDFWSQCHTLLILMEGPINGAFEGTFKGKFERHISLVNLPGGSGAHEAPYVALLIGSIQRGMRESPGASYTVAPLEIL